MAIIKLGELVTGIRGTAGGTTFSANKSGPYARMWSKGSNPRSYLQTLFRSFMSNWGARWAGMSAGDRALWDAFAHDPPELDFNSLGEAVELSGWQWFARVQMRRSMLQLAWTSSVPADTVPDAATGFGLTIYEPGAVDSTVAWTNGAIPAGHGAEVMTLVVPSQGVLYRESGRKQLVPWYEPGATGEIITDKMEDVWGTLQAGYRVLGWLWVIRADGVRSTEVTCSTTVLVQP